MMESIIFCSILPSTIIITLMCKYIGRYQIALYCIIIALISLLSWIIYLITNTVFYYIVPIYYFNLNILLQYSLVFFNFNVIFMNIVIVIATLIYVYISQYIPTDKHLIRLYVILYSFLLAMVIYINSYTYIFLFISWEVFGFISGILICYWKNTFEYIFNSFKALIINRIGDYCLTIAIAASINYALDDCKIHLLMSNGPFTDYFFIIILIGIACLCKSAQWPFFTWLYDAMTAPTPISALLHSATMVTAGVILFTNFLSYGMIIPTFKYDYLLYFFTACIMTSISTSVLSVGAFDSKLILAFSTSGQLAIISISLFLLSSLWAYLHLLNHAIFKTMVFLAVSHLIHSYSNNQDTRYFTTNPLFRPMSYFITLISAFNMIGLPIFAAFYTKHNILSSLFNNNTCIDIYAAFSIVVSIIFTTIYSLKIIRLIYFNLPTLNQAFIIKQIDYDIIVYTCFSILTILSITFIFYTCLFNISVYIYAPLYAISNTLLLSLSTYVAITSLYATCNFRYDKINYTLKYTLFYKLCYDFINTYISLYTLKAAYVYYFKLDKQLLNSIFSRILTYNNINLLIYRPNLYPLYTIPFIYFTVIYVLLFN